MTPSARLQAVLDLLTEIESVLRPADALTSAYFRSRRYIGSKDRAAVSAMLYDILRHRARLGWWIERAVPASTCRLSSPQGGRNPSSTGGEKNFPPAPLSDVGVHPPLGGRQVGGEAGNQTSRLNLIAYLILVEKRSAAQIDISFGGGKFSPAKLTDNERKLAAALETHTIEHPEMTEEVRVECPTWAAVPLRKRFRDTFLAEMCALLKPAPLDLRINPLKTTRDDMLAALKKEGIRAKACVLSVFGIRVAERPSLNALPMLKNGLVEIQDEGSQLVAAAVDAKPGMRVVDFCAGAGGKTLAIAAQMENKGRITACDVLEKRLRRSTERFRRAGVHNIEVKPLADERDPWVKKHKAMFDRVLADVPCTGVGAWRRNPDARWRSLGPGLENLVKLQAEILDSAARLVKPGGRIVYATCSMLPDENEHQVERFLAAHTEFTLCPYSKTADFLSLTPAADDTDGFFAAIMERKAV